MTTGTSQPIILERTFNAPVSKVWKALTDKDEMKKWYFDLAAFKAEPGFEFEFNGGPDDRVYRHLCQIKEVIPEKKLSYTWKYDGYPGSSLLTFELFSEGNKTRLKLTHSGLETFPADNNDFARSNFNQGWNDIINTSLKNYLEGSK
jgi:uncharacterized protein YndB with AHSA1/START domain